MTRVAILFDNFGPYHWSRLAAARRVCALLAVEVARRSDEYPWDPKAVAGGGERLEHECLCEGTTAGVSTSTIVARLSKVFDRFHPEVVFVPGWAGSAALALFQWCLDHDVPIVVMSESTAWDERRVVYKEWIKRQLVGLCAAGLAGGTPHAVYLKQLGLPRTRVFLGYDAVDNDYFERQAAEVTGLKSEVRRKHGLPEHYFLVSARFVEKKNLPRLLQAYARYRQLAGDGECRKQKTEIWDLVLLGDGSLRGTLNAQLSTLNLHSHVLLPGFKQYPELPAYYACASAFIHASTTEQWGLVVNEAMASSLPVLVSNRCGCASDLVHNGINGFTFNPFDVEALAKLMLKVSAFNFPLSAFGDASRRIVSEWGPERFAKGLMAAVAMALEVGPSKPSLLQQMVLRALLAR